MLYVIIHLTAACRRTIRGSFLVARVRIEISKFLGNYKRNFFDGLWFIKGVRIKTHIKWDGVVTQLRLLQIFIYMLELFKNVNG